MGQVHVITGVERRRRWSFDQKRAIVAAAFAPGAVVADVARQADVSSGLIYRWRPVAARPSGVFDGVCGGGDAADPPGSHGRTRTDD